jgi:Zn ribbon nucleic-acid-binding protein
MIQFDDENIILCINCDAEYTVTKYDGEEQEPEFCPFCGYHHDEDDDDMEESLDDDDDGYLN